jgi:alcohol dehydrogenase
MKPRHLSGMTRTIAFDQLSGVFDDFIKGKAKGRIVVDLAP